ncbi:hypothetical protein FOL46_010066 [Perkinsus olseni]|uniref:Uncharacterized protein n=1 Tax=Perkinsus olseni TaxID=32597 RepID=A0A7J6KVD6_PEROL|nr:hypothetical protein FOL46_010066 [Perkinsus olseni]
MEIARTQVGYKASSAFDRSTVECAPASPTSSAGRRTWRSPSLMKSGPRYVQGEEHVSTSVLAPPRDPDVLAVLHYRPSTVELVNSFHNCSGELVLVVHEFEASVADELDDRQCNSSSCAVIGRPVLPACTFGTTGEAKPLSTFILEIAAAIVKPHEASAAHDHSLCGVCPTQAAFVADGVVDMQVMNMRCFHHSLRIKTEE